MSRDSIVLLKDGTHIFSDYNARTGESIVPFEIRLKVQGFTSQVLGFQGGQVSLQAGDLDAYAKDRGFKTNSSVVKKVSRTINKASPLRVRWFGGKGYQLEWSRGKIQDVAPALRAIATELCKILDDPKRCMTSETSGMSNIYSKIIILLGPPTKSWASYADTLKLHLSPMDARRYYDSVGWFINRLGAYGLDVNMIRPIASPSDLYPGEQALTLSVSKCKIHVAYPCDPEDQGKHTTATIDGATADNTFSYFNPMLTTQEGTRYGLSLPKSETDEFTPRSGYRFPYRGGASPAVSKAEVDLAREALETEDFESFGELGPDIDGVRTFLGTYVSWHDGITDVIIGDQSYLVKEVELTNSVKIIEVGASDVRFSIRLGDLADLADDSDLSTKSKLDLTALKTYSNRLIKTTVYNRSFTCPGESHVKSLTMIAEAARADIDLLNHKLEGGMTLAKAGRALERIRSKQLNHFAFAILSGEEVNAGSSAQNAVHDVIDAPDNLKSTLKSVLDPISGEYSFELTNNQGVFFVDEYEAAVLIAYDVPITGMTKADFESLYELEHGWELDALSDFRDLESVGHLSKNEAYRLGVFDFDFSVIVDSNGYPKMITTDADTATKAFLLTKGLQQDYSTLTMTMFFANQLDMQYDL